MPMRLESNSNDFIFWESGFGLKWFIQFNLLIGQTVLALEATSRSLDSV